MPKRIGYLNNNFTYKGELGSSSNSKARHLELRLETMEKERLKYIATKARMDAKKMYAPKRKGKPLGKSFRGLMNSKIRFG